MPAPHTISNSPFASYDLVVYFGAGAFSLSVFWGALPNAIFFPKPLPNLTQFEPIVGSAVQVLFLSFSAYVFGHIIAYLADQFVEKAMISVVDYPIKWASELSNTKDHGRVRDLVRARGRMLLSSELSTASVLRIVFHLPMIPIYWITFLQMRMDGFYRSRLPENIHARVDRQIRLKKLNTSTQERDWFRIIEQYVINNHPVATARLYNYVVIYGLLRSLSFTFLVLYWMFLARWTYCVVIEFLDYNLTKASFISYCHDLVWHVAVYGSLCLITIFSFGKFYRRYTEEAIFSFVLFQEKNV